MNILHIVRTPRTVTAFLVPFLEEQKNQGHRVSVACNGDEDVSGIEKIGVEVHKYYLKRSLCLRNLYRAAGSLRRIFKQSDFDLIITHTPIASAIARLVAKLSRCRAKIIYVAHGLPCAPHQFRLKWVFWFTIEWTLGKITDGLLVMNNYDYNLACKTRMLCNHNRIRKIPGMGVDLEKFKANVSGPFDSFWEQFSIRHKKVILCVARLIREKGIFEFLQAAQLLSEKDYAFVSIGDGPCNHDVSQFIYKHKLDNVFLLGRRNDVNEFTKRCDLVVLPTYYFEGLPVTILEAMGCSKPVIATRHRGCEDVVIDEQTGYLVDVRNAQQLADKIELILSSESLANKMGAEGRRRVKKYFSVEYSVKSFCDEIATILRDCS